MFILPTQFYEPDPPAPFKYLANGDTYSIRPERRGANSYWFLRKMRGGKSATLYLAPAGSLSRDLLDNAVTQIDAQLNTQESNEVAQ